MLRRLCSLQRRVTIGKLADIQRIELMAALYDHGVSQVEIADTLNQASLLAGGTEVSVDAVQKAIRRHKENR